MLVNFYAFIIENNFKQSNIIRQTLCPLKDRGSNPKLWNQRYQSIKKISDLVFIPGVFSCVQAVFPRSQTSCCSADPSKSAACSACWKPSSSGVLLCFRFPSPKLDSKLLLADLSQFNLSFLLSFSFSFFYKIIVCSVIFTCWQNSLSLCHWCRRCSLCAVFCWLRAR